MHPLERVAAILLCVASLTGCANWAVDMAPDRPDQPWNPAVTATGEIVPGGKSPIESRQATFFPQMPNWPSCRSPSRSIGKEPIRCPN